MAAISFDEYGPFKIIKVHEPAVGLRGTLVVDNVARGPAIGGTRMAPDVSTEECFRLARAMTFKNAAADLPHGGGKSIIYGDPEMPREAKEPIVRAFACALKEVEQYIFGPDMGTNEECMGWIKDEIGRAVGLPREIGGIPLDEIGATGWGLLHAIEVACEFQGRELAGSRVAIQGFGAVGKNAARFLSERGAVIVAEADIGGTVSNSNGIDIEKLIEHKEAGEKLVQFDAGSGMATGDAESIIDTPCDIWIPAARPDVIRADNLDRLKASLVVSGANIAVTAEAEKIMHERGILSIPDFIANAGGVICAAMEYHGATEHAAFETIEEKIRSNTKTVLALARERGCLPSEAAIDMAKQRLHKAMDMRRWSLF